MQRNPLCDFIEMVASGATTSQQQQPPPPLDYAALLCSAFPQHYNANSSTQSEVVESVMQLPSEKKERPESPVSVTDSLPKEPEGGSLKRPAAIQELLLSRRARLCKSRTSTPTDSLSDGTPTSVTHTSSNIVIKSEQMAEPPTLSIPSEIEVKTESTNSEDAESVSGSHTCTETSTPPPSTDQKSMLLALQKQFLLYQQTIVHSPLTPLATSFCDSGPIENQLSTTVQIPDDRFFTHVPSRLTLLSQVVKYDMTVGEVRRRINGPEAFNFSVLGALLRRAKLPTKSNQLVDELANVGIIIPRGRRRAVVTLFSCLTESEALKLASDYATITEAEFPAKVLADKVSSDYFSERGTQDESTVKQERKQQLEGTREVITEFMNILNLDRSPVLNQSPEAVLLDDLQNPLSVFSMLTHGFGVPGIRVGMNAFHSYISHQLANLSDVKTT